VCHFLEHDAVQSDRILPTIGRDVRTPFSWSENKPISRFRSRPTQLKFHRWEHKHKQVQKDGSSRACSMRRDEETLKQREHSEGLGVDGRC
jgi:hypothetical protein